MPVEPALAQGATEIVALDLADPRGAPLEAPGFGAFLGRLWNTLEQRQTELELALAAARGVPVCHIALRGDTPVALWDFHFFGRLCPGDELYCPAPLGLAG